MAVKQFALPLDGNSRQTGDITVQQLAMNNADVEFSVTNVSTAGSRAQLNLITKKNGTETSHIFPVSGLNGTASATVSTSMMKAIYADASGGDRDYVEANWTVDAADTPDSSSLNLLQSGGTYDYIGWPPK